MAKLAIELSKYARKDGTRQVWIRVTHRGKMRRLPTTLIAYPDDLTRTRRIKNRALQEKADALVRDMYKAIDSVSYFDLQNCDVDFLVRKIQNYKVNESFHLGFFAFAESFVAEMANDSTRRTYNVALAAFRRYIDAKYPLIGDLDVKEITAELLRGFVRYEDQAPKFYFYKKKHAVVATKKEKRKGTAAKAYLSKLGAIFGAAKERYNDEDLGIVRIPHSPFGHVRVDAAPSSGERPLTLQQMRLIVSADSADEAEREALDVFIVSFGLMGANLADLYAATPPADGVWLYQRQKTRARRQDHAEMQVRVPEFLAPYIARLTRHARAGRWLNISERYSSMPSANKSVNDLLKTWAKRNGIAPFNMYAARKSWATIAQSRACGVDKATVDAGLGHVGTLRVADIYIQRDWEVLWAANEKVCDVVFNKH